MGLLLVHADLTTSGSPATRRFSLPVRALGSIDAKMRAPLSGLPHYLQAPVSARTTSCQLGAEGMGEGDRTHDSKLDGDVAIKSCLKHGPLIQPGSPASSEGPDLIQRRARFS